jgi:hypothetical protein
MYGFVITRLGRDLLLKWGAGAPRVLSDIMVGSGRVPDGTDLPLMTDLMLPVAQATSTVPQVADQQLSFVIEYRNDLNGGLATGFWLNEYGVFAIDPDLGRVLLCYATLGDYPQYVVAYSGGAIDIRRFPVTIGLSDNVNVTINYPPVAFVLAEDLQAAMDAIKAFWLSDETLRNKTVYGEMQEGPPPPLPPIRPPASTKRDFRMEGETLFNADLYGFYEGADALAAKPWANNTVVNNELLDLTAYSFAPLKPIAETATLTMLADYAEAGNETILLNTRRADYSFTPLMSDTDFAVLLFYPNIAEYSDDTILLN